MVPLASILEIAYQADPSKLRLVRWLAVMLGFVTAFTAAPAVVYFPAQPAPPWVWLVLFGSTVQGLFLVWMLATPDWASLRIAMGLFLLVAIGYGLMTLRVTGVPPDEHLPLGLDPVRQWASHWCTAVVLVMSLGAYLCGHFSHKWRRSFRVEMALRAARRKSAA